MKRFFEKNINRAAVFLCIIAVLIVMCSRFFVFADREKADTVLKEFYALNDNTVECIYFGSSITQRAYISPVAFHEYGVPSYIIASSSQPLVMVRYLMEESLKTQTPKVFIVELKGACKGVDDLTDVAVRKTVDVMPASLTKFKAIRAATKFASYGNTDVDLSGISYYFPFCKYHYLWNLSKRPHEYEDIDYYNGYSPNLGLTFKIRRLEMIEYDEHVGKIDEHMEEVINDLLDYCDTLEETKTVFVIHPYAADEAAMGKLNYVKNIVEDRGYECLNFLPDEKKEELGLRRDTCYYNSEHLNYYGALKFTQYMTEYLMENYGVTDVRGGEGYDIWESEYERLFDDLNGKYAKKYAHMKKKIKLIESEGN